MKVLLISHTCQSRSEGHPKAQALARLPGIDLRVLVPDRWRHYNRWRTPDLPEDKGFSMQVGRVAWPWVGPAQSYLHWYPDLPDLLRDFEPDVIDLWEEPWALVSAQACRLRDRLVPQARIISETEQNINRRLPPPFEGIRRYTLSRANHAVGRSAEAVQVLRAKGYCGPATVVPNAVDADLFRPLDRAACRRALGVSGFVVGYVGRLVPEKGLHEMVEALSDCPLDVRCVFVGTGPEEGPLRRRAQALEVSERIQFLPRRPQTDLPALMNAFDALVLMSRTTPTWKEQFGRVIIEAQACGIPVIGSDSGAIPEVIGQGGCVVPEGDARALAEAILRLRALPSSDASAIGLAGRRQVETHYTWQRVAQCMENIYETLLR